MATLSEQIFDVMKDHEWHTLAELVVKTGGKSPSVAARMRSLRTPKKGGHTIERRMHNDAYEYRIPSAATPAAPLPPVAKQRTIKAPVLSKDGLTVGQIIRGRRAQLFMTQADLAQKVGVSQLAVNHWEKFNRIPNGRFMPALAAALGISEEQILSGKQNERKKPVRKPKTKVRTPTINIDTNAIIAALMEALAKAQVR
jgi:transcriptional regulator with XRE-family HTH domain